LPTPDNYFFVFSNSESKNKIQKTIMCLNLLNQFPTGLLGPNDDKDPEAEEEAKQEAARKEAETATPAPTAEEAEIVNEDDAQNAGKSRSNLVKSD
jgi:hypothetical protein